MESEGSAVRIEVCQNCIEHHQTLLHSQSQFQQYFSQLKEICISLNLKVLKNMPFKYLVKANDTKNSTKRFLNTVENKIVEYPRKDSFQIYHYNVLIYSRLMLSAFPNMKIIRQILICLINAHQRDPLLSGFQQFQDIQLEWRDNKNQIGCLYEYIMNSKEKKSESKDKDIRTIINKLLLNKKSENEPEKKKLIHPYSLYATQQKQTKMQSIYCPNAVRVQFNTSKSHSKGHSKISQYLKGKNLKNLDSLHLNKQLKQLSLRKDKKNHNQLFDLVRMSGEKLNNSQNYKKSVNNKDLKKVQIKSKNLYISYLDTIRNNTIRNIKTTKRKPVKNLKRQQSANFKLKSKKSKDSLINIENQKKQTVQRESSLDIDQKETIKLQFSERDFQWVQKESIQKTERVACNKDDQVVVEQPKNEEIKKQQPEQLNKGQMQKTANLEQQCIFPKRISQRQEDVQQLWEQNLRIKQEMQRKKKTKMQQSLKRQQSIKARWEQEKQKDQFQKQHAIVIKKFTQEKHFYQDFGDIWLNQNCKEVYFEIDVDQINKCFYFKSLRQQFLADQLKLFPEIFRQVQNYDSKLADLVNLLLRSNPLIISRIFQNKKNLNPYGVYCIWLKTLQGSYSPIFVNDTFAFDSEENAIYGPISRDNSIWFMLLQKAVAKVLGGYSNINGVSLSTLMSVLMGCPTVNFSNLGIQKALKVFEQKNFFNKMATFYAIRDDDIQTNPSTLNHQSKIDRIVGFNLNPNNIRQSRMSLRSGDTKIEIDLHKFLKLYNEVTLTFYNSYFYMDQAKFSFQNIKNILTCKFESKSMKNNCYLIFSKMPVYKPTKIVIYQILGDEEADIILGMNPLSEERRRYQYIGQISKTGDFFFETQLQAGNFICIMENTFSQQKKPHIMIFSEHQMYIKETNNHVDFFKQKQNKQISLFNQKSKAKKTIQSQQKAPNILVVKQSKNITKCNQKTQVGSKNIGVKIKRHFIMQDESQSDQKQNIESINTDYMQRRQ